MTIYIAFVNGLLLENDVTQPVKRDQSTRCVPFIGRFFGSLFKQFCRGNLKINKKTDTQTGKTDNRSVQFDKNYNSVTLSHHDCLVGHFQMQFENIYKIYSESIY